MTQLFSWPALRMRVMPAVVSSLLENEHLTSDSAESNTVRL
jgi:hypothetical protein